MRTFEIAIIVIIGGSLLLLRGGIDAFSFSSSSLKRSRFLSTATTTRTTTRTTTGTTTTTTTKSYHSTSTSSSCATLHMSMKPTFGTLTARVVEKFGLEATDFADTYNAKTWSCPNTGVTGAATWLKESNPNFLTGVSFNARINADGTNEQLTINVWMGPSYDVPHMTLTFGEQGNGLYAVWADYVARGTTPIGSDPQYLEMYYGPDVTSAWDEAQIGPPLPPQESFEARLLASPARIAVGGLSSSDAEDVASSHLSRFLSWIDAARPIQARSRGGMNLRDDKLRQFFYRGELAKNVREFGDALGPVVAAVNTGPTAEAYVGGGS